MDPEPTPTPTPSAIVVEGSVDQQVADLRQRVGNLEETADGLRKAATARIEGDTRVEKSFLDDINEIVLGHR